MQISQVIQVLLRVFLQAESNLLGLSYARLVIIASALLSPMLLGPLSFQKSQPLTLVNRS